MKKMLSLCLAMVLCLTMVGPALADSVVIKMFTAENSGDGANYDGTNPIALFLEEMSGTCVDIEYPIGNGLEKLNIVLASGDYAEMLHFNDASIMNMLIAEEIALPLQDLIAEYAPNIITSFGEMYPKLYHTDGNLYSLPTGYGVSEYDENIIPATWSGWTFNVRGDLWKALGSPAINTLDDVYTLLVQMKEQMSSYGQGQAVYPLGGFVQSWQNMLETLINSAGGYNGRYYINEAAELSYWVRAPWAEDIIRWYNKVYRENLLDPEAFIMDRNTFVETKIGADMNHAYFGIFYYADSIMPNLIAMGYEAPEFEAFPVSVPVTGQRPNLVSESSLGSKYLVLTDKLADNPEKQQAAMRWLNALADDYGNFCVINGLEGMNWAFDESGVPRLTEAFLERYNNPDLTLVEKTDQVNTGADLYKFMLKSFGPSPYGTYMALKDDPANTGDERAYERQSRLSPYYYDTTFFSRIMLGASDDILYKNTNVGNTITNEVYECILAETEEECIALFKQYIANLESLGLVELEAFWNANYQVYLAQ